MKTTALVFLATVLVHAQDVPPEVLTRVAAIRHAPPDLWPNWDPNATPLAVYQRDQYTLLNGDVHPAAPFTPYMSQPGMFLAPTTTLPGIMLANTAQKLAGTLTSFVSAEDLLAKPTVGEAAALGMHELFHAHEQKIAPRKFGNVLVLLWGEYPEFNARNAVLLQMEATALHDAILATSETDKLARLADFLGLRAERRQNFAKEIAKDVIPYESGEEANEGLASYIEYRLLETAYPDSTAERERRLGELLTLGKLPNQRSRFYVMGMAEALLLDQVRPGWKQEYESSDAMLDDLLGRVTKADIHPRNISAPLFDQQDANAKREAEGSRAIGQMLAKGRKVVIEVSAVKNKINLRGINPSASLQLTSNHVVHVFLMLDLEDMKLEFRGVPIVYEKLQDVFWCVLPEDAVKKTIDTMGEKVVFDGKGFHMEFENVEVSQRGKEVRIRPSTVPEKKAPLKPVFVKPGIP